VLGTHPGSIHTAGAGYQRPFGPFGAVRSRGLAQVRRAGQDGNPHQVAAPDVRYADGLDGAGLAAEAEAGADEAGADDAGADEAGGAALVVVEAGADAVAVEVAVAVAVGVVGVGVGVRVGVLDLVGVGVGVTTAGRTDEGVYTGPVVDEALCEADGEVDALLGALDEDAGAEDVTAAGWSLN
jgi:hypothetical protein